MKQSAVIYTRRVPDSKAPDPQAPQQYVSIRIKNRGFLDCVRHNLEVLDGLWDFDYLGPDVDLTRPYSDLVPDRYGERAPVPGCFDTLPQYAGQRGTACYRRSISVTPGATGLLRFGGTGLWIRVYIDTQRVFEGFYPYCPLEVELPPADSSLREMVILFDNRFDSDRVLLFEPFFDFYAYGRIYRSVELQEVPSKYIKRLQVTPMDVERGVVRLNFCVKNGDKRPFEAALVFEDGLESQVGFEYRDGRHTVDMRSPEPQPWSPVDSHLHRVEVSIDSDRIEERFGLRVVEASQGEIPFNGEPIKLLGVCRHQAHPQFGPALPLGQLIQDLELIRGLGWDFVRGVHYPQDQRLLEL